MPKRVFWPAAILVMGLVVLAHQMGYLPQSFWFLWSVIMIVAGLGGLLLSDREKWEGQSQTTAARRKTAAKKTKSSSAKKTTTKKAARRKSK